MSRAFAAFGVGIATIVGIATAYVTFQPELQRQRDEQQGVFRDQHARPEANDNAISQAIISDLREAKDQAMDTTGKTGPAWKLRQMMFGRKKDAEPAIEQVPTAVLAVRQAHEEEKRSG
ncbi:hypothetical protein LTR08_003711 [Meristemomyces frigidus]|nr:hypothetical protein LTR08_003711 [Meristemomyces frigidus]